MLFPEVEDIVLLVMDNLSLILNEPVDFIIPLVVKSPVVGFNDPVVPYKIFDADILILPVQVTVNPVEFIFVADKFVVVTELEVKFCIFPDPRVQSDPSNDVE